MTARLHALYDDGVRALFFHALCEFHARHDGDDLHACRMKLFKVRNGIARAERDERRLFLTDHIHDLVLVRCHEHHIDTKRAIRQRTAAANLIARVLRRTPTRRDDARTARIRHRRREIRLRDPRHAALQDRNLNSQEFFELICHVTTSVNVPCDSYKETSNTSKQPLVKQAGKAHVLPPADFFRSSEAR